MVTLAEIQKEVMEARRRTSKNIGLRVKAGIFDVVEIEPKKSGNCNVVCLAKSLQSTQTIAFLQTMVA